MRILILDNYDSFTYNLYHMLLAYDGSHKSAQPVKVSVFRNDKIDIAQILEMKPSHILISPGPGHPANPKDFGICEQVIRILSQQIPILGVCLGHQGIAQVFGGKISPAPEIVHGKTSQIYHEGSSVFTGMKSPFTATRYHSLIVDADTLPDCLCVTATTKDQVIMGLQHREYPLFGVQFHPESIGTVSGQKIIENFLQANHT